ncbi:MAG: MFS transporter [Patescibacteria group bacterium]
MEKKDRRTVAVLCLVPFIMVLGNSMLIPVLPAIRKALHISLTQVGLLITAFSIPAGIVIPFAGLLSDRIGRKPVMAPALIVYGLGGLLAGLAGVIFRESYYLILGARVIQGLGAGGTYQLAMALAGDEIQTKERAQALGFLEAANGLGKVVSPLAGAALALIGWQAPFFVYGVLAFPIAAVVFWLAGEKKRDAAASQSIAQYFQGFAAIARKKGAALAVAFLAGMSALFTLFGVLSVFSDVLEKTYHIEVFGRGLILALPVLAMAATSFILGMVLKKKPAALIRPAACAGLCLVGGGLALFALLPAKGLGLVPPALAAVLVGLGTGAALPPLNTLITSAAPRKERGGLTCLYGTVRFFGVAIGPPVFALGLKGMKIPLYLGFAAAAALLALLSLAVIKPEKILPQNLQGGKGGKKNPAGEGGVDGWDPLEEI